MNRGAEIVNKEFARTFDQAGYDIGGTFIFTDGNTIQEPHAVYFCRLFLNELDKVYFGNAVSRKNIRLERDVFIHRTHDGGRWIHFHIWFKSVGKKELFRITAEKVWKKSIHNAGDAVVKEYSKGAGWYGWKEDREELGYNSWLQDLGHTDTGTTLYQESQIELKQDTLDRLNKLHITETTLLVRKKKINQWRWQHISRLA